jgi:hypothetical protein
LSYEAFLTKTGGVKQRSSRMSRWIAESLIAAGLSALGFCRAFFVAEFCLSLLPFRLSKRATKEKGLRGRRNWVESAGTAKVTQIDHAEAVMTVRS